MAGASVEETAAASGRTETRWLAAGQSTAADPREAGQAAARAALAGDDAKLVLVFASEAYDLEALLAGIREVTGDTPLIGCTSAGEIGPGGGSTSGVVVTALGGSGFAATTAVARGVSARLRPAGEEVAASLVAADESDHRAAILFTDALGGNQQEVIRGAYSVLGAGVPLVGGCAGDDFRMTATHQFFGGEVLADALVAALLTSDAPLGVGVRHGWRRVGDPVLVTQSANNRVYTLDDRPALDVYLERFDAPAEAATDAAAFAQFSMTHPLGLGRRSAEEGARFVSGCDFEDRSLAMIAEVPQGALAWFLEGDVDSVLEATDQACADAVAALEGREPLGLLAFDCAARRLVLGDERIAHEVGRIAAHAPGAPVAGFYSYGEIARTRGPAGFHNETLVVLAVS